MSQAKQKILIIEDETALTDVLRSRLKKEGYEVSAAEDGKKGYDAIIAWQPDLILLDIVMPKMDGYEVLEKMNKNNIKRPVIIISNSGQPVEIEKTKKLGAVDHLIKTEFDPQEVIAKVKAHLAGESRDEITDTAATEPIDPIQKDKNAKPDVGIKVLLVEDDSFLRSICSKKLVREGFTVYEAIDGEMALKEVEKIKPDIILLDIILPAIDGFGVLTEIKKISDKKIANIPIIMLSNLGQDDDIKKAIELGANDYLVKAHFTIEEIVTKIKKVLNK